MYCSFVEERATDDPNGFCEHGIPESISPSIPRAASSGMVSLYSLFSPESFVKKRTISIIPYFDVSYRELSLPKVFDVLSLSLPLSFILGILSPLFLSLPTPLLPPLLPHHVLPFSLIITPSIIDLPSFQFWWHHTDPPSHARFRSLLQNGQVQFNAGMWTAANIALLEENDLIDLLTAGKRWILSVFNVTVTTGIIMGDASYPRGFLSILRKAGLELVIMYHMSVNSPYFDKSDPYGPYYAHGGVNKTTGEFLSQTPNLYEFGPTSSDCIRIMHAYLEESRFVSHLVNVGCIADNTQ